MIGSSVHTVNQNTKGANSRDAQEMGRRDNQKLTIASPSKTRGCISLTVTLPLPSLLLTRGRFLMPVFLDFL